MFNPDSDPISEEAHLPSRTPENLEAFKVDLENMLDMAGFQPVPEEFITVSKAADGLRGFKVTLPPPEALKLKLYYQRLVPTIVRSTSNPYFLRTYFPVHDTSGVWQFEISRCDHLLEDRHLVVHCQHALYMASKLFTFTFTFTFVIRSTDSKQSLPHHPTWLTQLRCLLEGSDAR